MLELFWIINKKKYGPFSVAEAISQLQRGDVETQTLAWHRGCEDWMPLRELPALRDYFVSDGLGAVDSGNESEEDQMASIPPPPVSPEPAAPPTMKQMTQLYMPSSVQRFVARMLDYSIYLMLYAIVMYGLSVPYSEVWLPVNPLLWFTTVFIETLLIYQFRTTIGKKVMGVYIFSLNPHERFTLGRSLRRSMYAYIFGMGMMLFILPFPMALFTMFIAWFRLRTNKICMWDMRAMSMPLQKRPPKFMSYIVAFGLMAICVNISMRCFSYWQPAMQEAMLEHEDKLRETLPASLVDDILPEKEENVRQWTR